MTTARQTQPHARPDYVKLLLQCEHDYFRVWWSGLHAIAESLCTPYGLDFEKSHKINHFPTQHPGLYLYSVEIWGEASVAIRDCPFSTLHEKLRRFDVRRQLFDVTTDQISATGQALVAGGTTYNVTTYKSKPSSKRGGRDRGGQGFAIGSHKSDLRISVYKVAGHPAAMEFQASGALLKSCIQSVLDNLHPKSTDIALWAALCAEVERRGNNRFERVLEASGIGTHWPVDQNEITPPSQQSF